ncbi:MAG TPA: type II secretion system protein [Gammaproteobacteria bacterium]|nr:type II secretion system protein [Gammaproteobacteria bacterium]
MKAARQSGFTLIELVVVITILGILAAFAIPRFAALDQQARIAARDALAGSVRSGAALAHAMWLAQNQPAQIVMEGQTINITNGYPILAHIGRTISDLPSTGFNYTAATGVFARTGSFTTCTVTYAAPAAANLPPTITLSPGATTC